MSSPITDHRIVMDVTSLCCWEGHPTGIVRVERELAIWARRNLAAVDFAFFDPGQQVYRRLDDRWVDLGLAGDCVIDQRGLPDSSRKRPHFVDRIPRSTRPAAMWVLQFRRQLLQTLERARLNSTNVEAKRRLERLQSLVMTEKYRRLMIDPDGNRRPFLQAGDVLGEPIEFAAGDVLLSAGTGWANSNIRAVARLKKERGIRFAVLCYDIIVLQFPQFWKAHDIDVFKSHFHIAFPIANLVLVTSRRVEEDVRDYCRMQGFPLERTAVIPLGADPVRRPSESADVRRLGVEPGKYVLFVSTIEPRKGHRMLLAAWRLLKQRRIVQEHGYKLALVGRPGWLVDDLLAELNAEQASGSLVVLSNVDDGMLGALYRDASFCVFPSEYEGYGLPVVEAFQYGKAVIASTGGSVPEIVGGLMPCLDPRDTLAWADAIGRWISEPGERQSFEEAVRARHRPLTWDEASAGFFRTLQRELGSKTSVSGAKDEVEH